MIYSRQTCPSCNCKKEHFARIRIDILDKKTREIKEQIYGEIICVECLHKRYKGKNILRHYV